MLLTPLPTSHSLLPPLLFLPLYATAPCLTKQKEGVTDSQRRYLQMCPNQVNIRDNNVKLYLRYQYIRIYSSHVILNTYPSISDRSNLISKVSMSECILTFVIIYNNYLIFILIFPFQNVFLLCKPISHISISECIPNL